jgi:hypothetical protein
MIVNKVNPNTLNESNGMPLVAILISFWTKSIAVMILSYSEVEKVENWQDRLLKAIESKADVATFRQLLRETTGNTKVLVDKKDIQVAEQMVNRYCLCEGRWEEGVFMIACDDCDDWFHCEYVISPLCCRFLSYVVSFYLFSIAVLT